MVQNSDVENSNIKSSCAAGGNDPAITELLDVVDESGMPTGATVPRATAHAEGMRHRTAQIWVIRRKPDTDAQGKEKSDGGTTVQTIEKPGGADIVMQKRAMNKDSFPGTYDTSSAGHIQAGDEPLASALRELHEELGIEAAVEDLTFIGTYRNEYECEFYGKPFKDNEVAFVYVYEKPIDIEKLVLQKEEVESVKWIDFREALEKCTAPRDPGYCAPVKGLKTLERYLFPQ